MAWIDIKDFKYAATNLEGECVALFVSNFARDKFVEQFNSSLEGDSTQYQLSCGEYVDFSTDIQVRAE